MMKISQMLKVNRMIDLLREFRPALIFLSKFLAIYFVCNVLYGLYIESCGASPDLFTVETARQTSWLLNALGESTEIGLSDQSPRVALKSGRETVINVFEGCNGINVIVIFGAFLISFGGPRRNLSWFMCGGIVLIHLTNLARLALLYLTAIHRPADFYYFHKYLFTGILYVIVFLMWTIWVLKLQRKVRAQRVA